MTPTSPERTPDPPPDQWWLGPDSKRLVTVSGWIFDDPRPGTKADVAHLLLHPPPGEEADSERLLALAEGLGLARSDTPAVDVPAETTHASLEDSGPHGRMVRLHYQDRAWISMAITSDWEQAARTQEFVILSLGIDTLSIRTLRDIDTYVAKVGRIYTGRVRAA